MESYIQVQNKVRRLKYNFSATMRPPREVERLGSAHCMEGALYAAYLMERFGFDPVVMSFESVDDLDHVIFVFQKNGLFGSIGKSRDQGLHGRHPVFRSLRELASSYLEPYVDLTGRITGFQVFHLDETGIDWRGTRRPLWKLEKHFLSVEHVSLNVSDRKYSQWLARYKSKGPLLSGPSWI